MVSKEYKQFSIRFIHIALGFIVFTLPTSSIADTRYIHFEVLEISFNDLVKPIANYKVNAKSVIDCSRKCFNSDTCLSVVYHQEMDECYFNTQQVFLQPGAVIPSLSSSYSLVPLTAVSTVYIYLSYDVASGSEKTPCNKIDKPLVVYRFTGNVMTSITTLRS